jgi:hypothetical protein
MASPQTARSGLGLAVFREQVCGRQHAIARMISDPSPGRPRTLHDLEFSACLALPSFGSETTSGSLTILP